MSDAIRELPDAALLFGALVVAAVLLALALFVVGAIWAQVDDARRHRADERVLTRKQWTDTPRGRGEEADRLTYLDDYEAADQEDFR